MVIDEDTALSVCEYVVSKGLSKGATEVEAYLTYARSVTASVENNRLHTASESYDFGVGIRVAKGKRVGFSFTNKLDSESLVNAIDKALDAASSTPEDQSWRGFPGGPFTYASPSGTYSSRIAKKEIRDAVELTKLMMEYALRDKRITVVEAGTAFSEGLVAIMNSHNVRGVDKWTATYMAIAVVANDGTYTTPIVYEWWGSRLSEGDPRRIASRAVTKATSALNPIKVSSGKYHVILEPEALTSLFNYTVKPALRGDFVVRGRSPLKGREGELIASEYLSIVDDGLAPGGLATSKFDGEGIPKRRTELIIKGVLRGFIYDTYWGRKAERTSTGNAVRGSYSTQPHVGFSNFIVGNSSESLETHLSSIEGALLVNELQGAHSSNPETGEFSVVGVPTWLVRKGELRAVKGVMIVGNVWNLLKRIEFISKERKILTSNFVPWIGFSGVRVVTQ